MAEALISHDCADEDGNVTPYMLNEYIDHKIRSLSPEKRPKQTPLLNCSTAGKIILARLTNTKTKSTSDRLTELLIGQRIEEFNKLRKDMPLYLRKLNLSGKRLVGANLHEADLTETKLINAKLNNADLTGERLVASDLTRAELRSADLIGANFSRANLTGVDLRGADLRGMIDFSRANAPNHDYMHDMS